MGVTFVLGRPSGRREDVIVGQIKERTAGDALAPVFVIVPPQATYATECMILEQLRAEGMMGVNVASISRVALRVLEEVYGGAQPTVDAAGKSMMVKRILAENAAALPVFGKMRGREMLPPQIADAITELKQLDVTPQMLRAYEAKDPDTAAKFSELALLYEKLDEAMGGKFDTEDMLDTVISHIHEAEFLRGAQVFIHGFDMYNSQTVRFITEVMKTAAHTVISFLYADSNAPDGGVYEICTENRLRFLETAQALGLDTVKVTDEEAKPAAILHMEKNLFAYPAKRGGAAACIHIAHAKNAREEVDGVMAQVALLTQKQGYSFSEIAVVCGDATRYLPLLRERFALAGIPCYTGEKRALLQCGLADFILSAVELSRGRIRKDTILAHAAAGYTALDDEQRWALQNYAFENIRDGFVFLKEFDGEIEDARQALMSPIENMRKRAAKAKNAAMVIGSVQRYLEELSLKERVEAEAAAMRKAGIYEAAAFTEQAYGRAMNALAQASSILGAENSASRIAASLRAGFAAEQVAVIPPAVEEVLCGDISGTWLPRVRALFVLGMNDGVIPDYAPAADILTEGEREQILGGIKGLKHTGKMDKQKLAVVKALSRPSEQLFLSYVRDGQVMPSLLLDRILDMFGDIVEDDLGEIAPQFARNAWERSVSALRQAVDGAGNAAGEQAVAAVLDDPVYAPLLEASAQRMAGENCAARVSRAGELYGTFSSSATRIEEFYACPYKHYMDYGLRAKEPRECGVDGLDVGLYAHNVLDKLARRLKEAGEGWSGDRGAFDAALAESVTEARAEYGKYALNRHNETVINAVTKELNTVAEAIRAQSENGALQPQETEYAFDMDGLRGVIDRIDTANVNGVDYFSIVDYKTGQKDFDIAKLFGGLDLQLILYVMAAQALLGEEYLCGGANYMRVKSAIRGRGEALLPLYRMRGIEGASSEAAQALYGMGEGNSLFSVAMRVKAEGGFYSQDEGRYLPPEEMAVAAAWVDKLVNEAKGRILAGDDAITPAAYRGTETACRYCPYNAVCRFDREDPRGARTIPALKKAEALAEMRARL